MERTLNLKELKQNLKKNFLEYPIIKVALLGDTATQFLATAIQGVGIESKFNIELFEADYNQVERQFLDSTSELYAFNANYVVVFQSTHKLMSKYSLSLEKQNTFADEQLEFVQMMCNSVSSRLIYFNFPEIEDTVFGSYANKVAHSFTYQIRKLNYELMNLALRNPNLFICDIAGLQNKFGRDWMFDSSVYVITEMLLSVDAIPYVASRVMDIISAAEGKIKKCIILDLDNTVWGGVIGDDGMEGIQLGHGLGVGKAFSEFQQWIKKLKNRGIIVCVCSKNNEETAKEPFEKHPDMVLRMEDISVFKANWDNKADNIRQIQSILNIGFDSMVFLDDNPFERNLVRENIPEICIPELPEDPANYLEYLYELNLFETVSFSNEDIERTKLYQIEAERVKTYQKFTNEDDFLKNLEMLSDIQSFNKFNTPRIAQLSQRSNQFNLRTVRYTEVDIEKISDSKDYVTFAFTLEDKFGDNGLICVIILHIENEKSLFIDTWFMSCRVLKRGMENFVFNRIVLFAKENGFTTIKGEYIPTAKNEMVKDHYLNLGFEKQNDNYWSLNCNNYEKLNTYINQKNSSRLAPGSFI